MELFRSSACYVYYSAVIVIFSRITVIGPKYRSGSIADAAKHFPSFLPKRSRCTILNPIKLIYDNLAEGVEKSIIHKDDVLNLVKERDFDVLIVLGAGDLDNYTPQIAEIIKAK